MDIKNLPIIVIGTGSVGIKFVNELLYRQPGAVIKIFGGEEQHPYSRESLSKLLAGNITKDSLFTTNKIHTSKDVKAYLNNPIVSIDSEKKEVTDSDGIQHAYKKLVIAVGSQPSLLNIQGKDLKNVFTLNNINDAELLKSRQVSSRHTIIIGAGLVGLDTACAMTKHKTKISIIENHSILMNKLLDKSASVYLRLFLDDRGIDVHNQTNVVKIEGKTKVEKIVLDDGTIIPCDTIICSTGTIPNTALAANSNLNINQGILVDDTLQTSHEDIFAVGECIEHRDKIYNTVQPGFEQAAVLAKIIAGGKAKYKGSIISTQLGVVEYPILSIGNTNSDSDDDTEIIYRDIKRMIYRKLVLNGGNLQGVIATGPWRMSSSMLKLVEKKQYLWPWQRKKFVETGNF